jgi:predicted tellurium resistance membrane protein TerC
MRALYSLLAEYLVRLKFLHVGLAVVLVFVGAKMVLAPFIKIQVIASLAVVVGAIGGAALVSLLAPSLPLLANHRAANDVQRLQPFLSSREKRRAAESARQAANRLEKVG